MARNSDLAWAAGLFEGEGHFSIRSRGSGWRSQFEMGLTSTDRDVVDRFAQVAQCGNVRERQRLAKDHWKPQHNWTCGGQLALAFASSIKPYLGQRRRQRLAEIERELNATKPADRPCELCKQTFTPTRFDRQRFCSSKCRDRAKYLRRRSPSDP